MLGPVKDSVALIVTKYEKSAYNSPLHPSNLNKAPGQDRRQVQLGSLYFLRSLLKCIVYCILLLIYPAAFTIL